jgi:fructan beta-fructosidase
MPSVVPALILILALLPAFAMAIGGQRADIPISHFDKQGFGDWKLEGAAFGSAPVEGVATTKPAGDSATGKLTSPEFRIERSYISFRIAGGDQERYTCLDLLIDGKVVKSATGRNSDELEPQSWDVKPFHGHRAKIEIIDVATGDWGHVSVAHIIATDHPEKLPVTTQPLYHETLRPQFHFTARQFTMDRLNPVEHQEGWINDLNGLIYYDGEYHLFAQRWATCWLHAVSRDLIHWKELDPAFWEEAPGVGVQSGTCVIDYHNTSGLSSDPNNPPMIAFWSRFDNLSQCLCYSLDHGRTWTHYPKNPYMEHPERDPKVFWFEPAKHWVMMMYGEGAYHILTSPNLLDWKDEHHPIPDSFECPDFFELPVDGHANQKKWVLIQGNGNYSVGDFDGTQFHEETPRFACDIGPDFYATQSWANTETGDGRRIQVAWMRGAAFPEMPFSQEISFPCELTLRTTPAGLRVHRQPIKEIDKLQGSRQERPELEVQPGSSVPLEETGDLFRIRAEVAIPEGAALIFHLCGEEVKLTPESIQNGSANAKTSTKIRRVEILLDRGSIEAFVNHGELSSTRFVIPRGKGISVSAEGSAVTLKHLRIDRLKSIW